MLSSNARAEFDSAELDFGLWTAVFLWKIRGPHWDPAGHHQHVKTLALRRLPLSYSENLGWPVSRHSSLEQTQGYLF